MPCVQSTSLAINREWAALLRGLRMNVPDNWWPGFAGNNLNGGVIARVDLDIVTNNHFQLELDNEPGSFYAMRYDAVAIIVEDVNEDDDDDDDFSTPPPPARNKRCHLQMKQMTINPDSSMFGKDGTADGGIAADVSKQAAVEEVLRLARGRGRGDAG
ncbi:hypothetical protein ACHAW5_007544 [Stephanodiscus triporus]|uniref:FACT complex subunit n=1 Tax=Stephanodiscus triporus TaxID=2934178 RepID=A0ABD3QBQ0_9STRA